MQKAIIILLWQQTIRGLCTNSWSGHGGDDGGTWRLFVVAFGPQFIPFSLGALYSSSVPCITCSYCSYSLSSSSLSCSSSSSFGSLHFPPPLAPSPRWLSLLLVRPLFVLVLRLLLLILLLPFPSLGPPPPPPPHAPIRSHLVW